ncbi:uncharacterized protein LOC119719282 [Patiria miniata]|uniref:Uncharacterized protein n=1 Tax=Patiria miniata TaxID=46514 RepID=A0A913Z1P7_PATMI|nr:uncharacterized protein LOC119719282 [Patiria miniata]
MELLRLTIFLLISGLVVCSLTENEDEISGEESTDLKNYLREVHRAMSNHLAKRETSKDNQPATRDMSDGGLSNSKIDTMGLGRRKAGMKRSKHGRIKYLRLHKGDGHHRRGRPTAGMKLTRSKRGSGGYFGYYKGMF